MATAKKAAKKAAPAKKAVAKKPVAKKAAVKAAPAKKAPAKKAVAKKAKVKRKPSAAFMAPKQPDDVLGAIVGSKPIPRTEITKKVWEYIKKNKLQDAKNRRMINADEKLLVLFNKKKQVSMFDLTKLVNDHLK
jgi:upstream activation factor subunit UAF30